MGRAISVFFLIGAIFATLFLTRSQKLPLITPVSKIYGVAKTQIFDDWTPIAKNTAQVAQNLNLSAKAAIVVDFDTGEVIFAKSDNLKLPVASIVKIMTALVVLENADLDKVLTVSERAANVGENSMGLAIGEKLTVRELLYGLMLVSGNDAATALAEGVAGSEDQFVQMMNQKADSLGLKNTRFVNSSGLDEDDKSQYSTAYDLAVISHFVWKNYPEFRKVTSAVHEYIGSNGNHKAFDLYNDTNLLTTYPGVAGIKPGFTWEAGLCLVTYAENDNKKLLAVILGSDDRRFEMKELLDYGFNYFGISIFHPALP